MVFDVKIKIRKIHYFLVVITLVTLSLSVSLRGLSRPITSFQVDGKPFLGDIIALSDPSPSDIAWIGSIDNVISVKTTKDIFVTLTSIENGSTVLDISMNSSDHFKGVALIFDANNTNIVQYPWLEMSVKISSLLGYGIRFVSEGQIIYTEFSQMEHLYGSKFINVNIGSYLRNFGSNLTNLDGLYFYVEAPAELNGSFRVSVSAIKIFNRTILSFDKSSKGDFRQIILSFKEIPYITHPNLTLTRIVATFDVKGTDDLRYVPTMTIRLSAQVALPYQRSCGFTYAARAGFLFEVAVVHDFKERKYLVQHDYPIEGNLFFSLDATQGRFHEFNLHTVTLFFTSQPFVVGIPLTTDLRMDILLYLIIVFLVPLTIMLLLVDLFYHSDVSKRAMVYMSVIGFLIRLVVAPFTGGYDLGQWSFWTRSYFESGQIDLQHFPILPPLYWILIGSTSYYHLLRIIGVQDTVFILHPNGMLEAVFLKLPFILSDIFIALLIYRLIPSKRNGQRLVYASSYLMNPLPIYVSSALGTYEGIMIAFLCLGLYYIHQRFYVKSSLALVLGGMVKLFPFFLYAIFLFSLVHKRKWNTVLRVIVTTLIIVVVTVLPLGFNFEVLYESLFLRMLGLSGASEAQTNLLSTVLNLRVTVVAQSLLLLILSILIIFAVYQTKERDFDLSLLLKTMITMAILIYLLQISAGNYWYLWIIPLLIFLGNLNKNEDHLVGYSYILGTFFFFLISIHFHGFGLIITGEPYNLTMTESLPKIIGHLNVFFALILTIFYVFTSQRVKDKLQFLIYSSLIYVILYLFTVFVYG